MKHLILLSLLFTSVTFHNLFAQTTQPVSDISLNHIAVSVMDLEESEVFYRDVLGLEQIEEPFNVGRHVWFSVGSAELHLIKSLESREEQNINNHLCFSVPDLDLFIENLNKHDVPFSDWGGSTGEITQRPDGVQQIYITDPDGYWIEINDAK